MTASRNALVDYGCMFAAVGTVWFNTHVIGDRIAYAALPFFLVLLSMPFGTSVSERARKLLWPFLVWSCVYAAFSLAFAVKHDEPPFGWWEWQMLLGGTWPHLWLLPFAFLVSVLVPWLRHPLVTCWAALLGAGMLAFVGTPVTPPFSQWAFGLIPVLVGVGFFAWGWRFASVVLLASWLILHFFRPSEDNAVILAGSILALAILSNHLPQTSFSSWCARLSIGVYLVHPLAIILGQSLRITWVELGLFSIAVSVIFAALIDAAGQPPRDATVRP
ncbi:MAG TPA: hypothetical protein PKA03_09320 [Tabrizicola sp.]|nr:hypothetical protein [Tabrizicola sp.]